MKPCNFPGRKNSRRERAIARRDDKPEPARHPTVADIRFRAGAFNRDAVTGIARAVKGA